MSTAIAEEIEVRNNGPVESLRIPVRPEGGVVLLRGPQGCGKSITLEAINTLVTGEGSLTKRDGAPRGEVTFGDARLSIVKQTTRNGAELAIVGIDGKLDIGTLIDPGLKDPEKADAVRIKKIVQLGGITPDIALFHPLAVDKDEFDAVVGPDASEADDILTMAARIKRHFEAAARKAHDQAENYQGVAVGHREAALGYDETVEAEPGKLQAALEDAIREQQRLESEDRAASQHNVAIIEAREAIEKAQAESKFPPVAEALSAENAAREAYKATEAEVKVLEEALRDARVEKSKREAALMNAIRTREASEQHEKTLGAWAQTASMSEQANVPEETLAEAKARVQTCRQAVETGALMRDKRDRVAKADTADRMAFDARKRSERLRDAARATDEILSGLVAQCGTDLRVERGRIVTSTDRGTECFSELSDGERATIGIKIGVKALDRMGVDERLRLLTVPQRFWGELQPKVKREIDRVAREMRVSVVTAEATDDEGISATAFEG